MSSKMTPTDETFELYESDRFSGTTMRSSRIRDSTYQIPSPGTQGIKHKPYVRATGGPFWQSLVIQLFIVGTSYYEASIGDRYTTDHVGTGDWARGCVIPVKQKQWYVPACYIVISGTATFRQASRSLRATFLMSLEMYLVNSLL